MDDRLASTNEQLRITLIIVAAALLALVLCGMAIRLLVRIARLIATAVVALRRSPRRGVMSLVIALGSATAALTKALWTTQTQSTTSPTDGRDYNTSSPRPGSPLPALASMGLAASLAGHVQRERRVLLEDAPNTARLAPPRGAASATGIAVFERARGWNPSPSGSALIVPLGVADDRLVQLSIVTGALIAVEAPENESDSVLRHIVNTLALAPWLGAPRLLVLGFASEDLVGGANVIVVESESQLCEEVVRAPTAPGTPPPIVVTRRELSCAGELSDLGVTVISALPIDAVGTVRIVREETHWRVSSTNEVFQPYGLSAQEAADFRNMVREMTTLEHADARSSAPTSDEDPLADPANDCSRISVRVMGPVRVLTGDGDEVEFRKAKSVELLCWLIFHRDRPTVSAARTALWEIDVEDATFHNVLSEVRRAFAQWGNREIVRREGKSRLVLHPQVESDVEALQRVVCAHESMDDIERMHELQRILVGIGGLPFAGHDYAWADAEGITSMIVWLVTRAINQACMIAREHGEHDVVFAVTAAGLRMLPGDEHFLLLRERLQPKFAPASTDQATIPAESGVRIRVDA